MSLALLIDFGSTWTKLLALDLESSALLATAQGPSAVPSDVNIGLDVALGALTCQMRGARSFAYRLASSSAAGGLRMVTIGLVREPPRKPRDRRCSARVPSSAAPSRTGSRQRTSRRSRRAFAALLFTLGAYMFWKALRGSSATMYVLALSAGIPCAREPNGDRIDHPSLASMPVVALRSDSARKQADRR